ncbi:unnamed protein product [Protopolystoma xenopodis]|uniref:Uncharacterized protein n=1 Tax=Protopolystoma xenopodis TaxID=117903 RepID=A0A448WHP7_9PLAT|nr:unnamed protein product [Protopolystoma xenopodis]
MSAGVKIGNRLLPKDRWESKKMNCQKSYPTLQVLCTTLSEGELKPETSLSPQHVFSHLFIGFAAIFPSDKPKLVSLAPYRDIP